jgi:hypothetical protein
MNKFNKESENISFSKIADEAFRDGKKDLALLLLDQDTVPGLFILLFY